MPVEEIETTETIQKKTTEKIVICDSCGLNSDYDESNVYRFDNEEISEELYFCEECLNNDNTNPMTDGITIPFTGEKFSPSDTVVILSSATMLFLWSFGISGIFGDRILIRLVVGIVFFILSLVVYLFIWTIYGGIMQGFVESTN